ncbi:hypothetical protein B296_00036602 [Ensete ventricosum]|uniref:Uncharacterized protein n=1 Tax=Ensete ventricosum TaxID=4639 RepID=A0A426ZX57_ENSVE|nr:hypothetical protein B296_00036602 [Ensete ventricosum]
MTQWPSTSGELTVPVEEIIPAQELADPHGSGIGQISKIAGSSNRQVGFPGSTFSRPVSQIPGTRQSSEGPHRHHTPVDGVLLRGLNLRLLDAGVAPWPWLGSRRRTWTTSSRSWGHVRRSGSRPDGPSPGEKETTATSTAQRVEIKDWSVTLSIS